MSMQLLPRRPGRTARWTNLALGLVATLFLGPASRSVHGITVFDALPAGVTAAPTPRPTLPSSVFQGTDGRLYRTTARQEDLPVDPVAESGFASGDLFAGGSLPTGSLQPLAGYLATPVYQRLHSFWRAPKNPQASVYQTGDGRLWGTAVSGGFGDRGVLYRCQPDGTGFTIVHAFTGTTNDGSAPGASVILANDGKLYGTTQFGGASNAGTLYRLNPDGTGFEVIHSFSLPTGAIPLAAVLQGSDGKLYGTAQFGGSGGRGIVYRLELDGTDFTVLHAFTGSTSDGSTPHARVIEGADGKLYGTTFQGGTANYGTLFRLTRDGTDFEVLHSFSLTGGDGVKPEGPVLIASDGKLYGATYAGGGEGRGVIFRINTDGTEYELLRTLTTASGVPQYPIGGLVEGPGAVLYGSSTQGGANGVGTVFRLRLDGSNFTVIHDFKPSEGQRPRDNLIRAADGRLIGIAQTGTPSAGGGVFGLNPDGTGFALLLEIAADGDEGYQPLAPPAQGPDGTLYGSAANGGIGNSGTLYRMAADGSGFQVLHTFSQTNTNGFNPQSTLLLASDGRLYGTTVEGGSGSGGTVFRLQTDGTGYEVLHQFAYPGPQSPYDALLQANDGKLYGTTQFGGTGSGGALFRLALDGTQFEILHQFAGGANDGQIPAGALSQGADGLIYGTTFEGGSANAGTVFRLNPVSGAFDVLYSFTGTPADQGNPTEGVIQAPDGSLCGTTARIDSSMNGTVFRLNTDGSGYLKLHEFTGVDGDGGNPVGRLSVDDQGILYGATSAGGPNGTGSVYRLAPDGTGYEVVYSPSVAEGIAIVGVESGRFGVLYGATRSGGASVQGTAFRLIVQSVVAGRSVFYDGSTWDAAGDDHAIALDKTALRPGQKASFANYTSYSRGVNGIMIDVMGLPGSPGEADFSFTTGNTATPDAWTNAPAPSTFSIRPGAGIDGSHRLVFTWGANAVKKKWLRTAVLATAETGLANPDVFYFGNAVGETGNSPTDARVTSADALRVMANVTTTAAITNRFDHNRDGRVGAADRLQVLGNLSALDPLLLLDLTSAPAPNALGTTGAALGIRGAEMTRVPAGLRFRWISDGAPAVIRTSAATAGAEWETYDELAAPAPAGQPQEVILPIDAELSPRFYRVESLRAPLR